MVVCKTCWYSFRFSVCDLLELKRVLLTVWSLLNFRIFAYLLCSPICSKEKESFRCSRIGSVKYINQSVSLTADVALLKVNFEDFIYSNVGLERTRLEQNETFQPKMVNYYYHFKFKSIDFKVSRMFVTFTWLFIDVLILSTLVDRIIETVYLSGINFHDRENSFYRRTLQHAV